MKAQYKIIITNLLLCISTIVTAQVSQIPFNPYKPEFSQQIKYENNKLFITHSSGVFYQDYSLGYLPIDWGIDGHLWENYGFIGQPINDFIINGNKIIGLTDNYYPFGHLLIRSNDGGKTFEEFTPEILNKENLPEGIRITHILQNPNNLDEILIFGCGVYHSKDFGETWEMYIEGITPVYKINIAKNHPSDFNIIIVGSHSMKNVVPNGIFMISTDGGKTLQSINYYGEDFRYPETIAFHYSNPDIILIGELPLVKSLDKGKTWEVVGDIYCSGFDFDTRGSNRLYSVNTNLAYSDDFGATWNELCEIGLGEDDYVVDFVQQGSKIYTYSKDFKVHQIDLELLESAVEEVSIDDGRVSVSVVGNNLQINSQTTISNVDIFNIGGMKVAAQESPANSIDISDLANGTYIARLQAVNDNTVSVKFNK